MPKAVVCILHDQCSPDYIHTLKRADTCKIAPGKDCLPGGHIEPGEGMREACIREVKEETGFDIDPAYMTYYDTVELAGIKTAVYRCWSYKNTTMQRTATVSAEHSTANLRQYTHINDDLGPDTKKLLEQYKASMQKDDAFRKLVYPGVKDIIIGQIVEPPMKAEVFEVALEYYSGDADAYHKITGTYALSDKAQMIYDLDMIRTICESNLIHNDPEDWPEAERKFLREIDRRIEWPADCYCYERMATLDDITVHYYNTDGVKHTCTVKTL